MNTNILLLSAGRRVKLFHLLVKELAEIYPDSHIIVADANPEFSAVCRIATHFVKLPYTTDDHFNSSLKKVCEENNIGLIIPTTDFDINALALAVEEKMIPEGTHALVSSKDFVLKCQDKVLTCAIFKDANVDFLMPLTVSDFEYPIFMKPRYGYNTEQCRIIDEEADLPRSILELEDYDDYIFQYYLSPQQFDEYTIDCYYSKEGKLVSAVPRLRIKVKGGEVTKSITLKNEVYKWVWENFAELQEAKGPITLQCFFQRETKEIVAGEINPRFGGGYTLSYAAGANYVRYIFEEYVLNKTIVPNEAWKENILMLRYDEEIIIGK